MLGYIWTCVYTSFLRFWLKWLVRQATGQCELQRICSGYKPGATRTMKAEYSLRSSKSKVLRGALETDKEKLEQCVDEIIKVKNVKPQKDPLFKERLHTCLVQITGHSSLFVSVEALRKEVFNTENQEHEAMLLKLWDLLMPTVKLESRITKQWGDIGFQGDDPKTDFRGMGMLGLVNLVSMLPICGLDVLRRCSVISLMLLKEELRSGLQSFFSENYAEKARQVLSHANHPKLGYSYAIVGINLTEMAYSLLKNGALKPHFYNTVQGSPELWHFHQLYCYLAYEFDKFWVAEEPESIMQFNQYREKFHDIVKTHLQDPDVSLTLTLRSEKN